MNLPQINVEYCLLKFHPVYLELCLNKQTVIFFTHIHILIYQKMAGGRGKGVKVKVRERNKGKGKYGIREVKLNMAREKVKVALVR